MHQDLTHVMSMGLLFKVSFRLARSLNKRFIDKYMPNTCPYTVIFFVENMIPIFLKKNSEFVIRKTML